MKRRVLAVFPRYAPSFGTMEHAFPIAAVKAFMPPQGLLVLAAYLPSEWEVRIVDENVRALTDPDLAWADVVMVTGMHVQRAGISEILHRARASRTLSVLGGPSVSASPEWYGAADIIHLGEIGDATDALIRRLESDVSPGPVQERFVTRDRLDMDRMPVPAYGAIRMADYFIGSVQASSGCPYHCEFCDIPALYGNRARAKSPEHIVAELDAILRSGNPGAVYFVDDNFTANPKSAVALLEALVEWQAARGFPLQFACEASLDVTKRPRVLELMRQACVTTMFCGIETPETEALQLMGKTQNLRTPLLEAVATINSYGIEVVSGIILGLDSDTPDTYRNVVSFVEAAAIPMCTVNMVQALPRTRLYDRLERSGRLTSDPADPTNVRFLLPRDTVVAGWRSVIDALFSPEALYRRYEHQIRTTYRYRRSIPATRARLAPSLLWRGLRMSAGVLWHVGVRADYRRVFWQFVRRVHRQASIEDLLQAATVAHHLIRFAREAVAGRTEHSFYAPAGRALLDPAAG
ncbi:MAG TPA: radical SAM protein [Acidimicrobiales bacterium]|nr:radical SAM protein [Acidimicrobiales bacterium]